MAHWITGQDGSTSSKGNKTQPTDEATVLILGAGTFGTSAAYHLARSYQDPSKVTVIDRAPGPPKPAAAIDINRVIRTDYASPLYSNLAYEAWHAWFWSMELQAYFHPTGWLMMDDSPGSSLSRAIRQQFKSRGSDPTEDVSLDDIPKRWGGIMEGTAIKDFDSAYFNPESGWCDAAGATHNFMQAAEKLGVRRVTASIEELLLGDDRSHVLGVQTGDGQEFRADKIVIATGAWTSSLLSPLEDTLQILAKDRIENQLRTIGVLQIYYPVTAKEVSRLEENKMPVVVYGQQAEVIPPHRKGNLLKYTHNNSFTNTTTTQSGARITCPSGATYESQLHDIPDALKREAEDAFASRLMPKLIKGRPVDHWRVCYDARTPTEDFLICKYPHKGLSNLYIATGGSSHSYKFLPNIGKYVLNMLQDKSNGEEKDKAWAWKEQGWDVRENSPEHPKLGAWTPKRELRDIGASSGGSKL